jgi:hypothetical protein
MAKSRSQQLSEQFTEQWQRCRDWLVPFMQNNQPKFLTKDELRSAAMRELKVSKNAFDFAWMAAIEDAGRQDLVRAATPTAAHQELASPPPRVPKELP